MDLSSVLKNIPFFKNLSFFSSKSESVLGIDIGSSSVKIVQLRKQRERAVLETYGELSTGYYGGVEIGQAAVLVDEKAADMLKDIFRESGANAKSAVISIPLKSSFVTMVELPEVSEEKVESMITIEARRHIPVPLSEVALDWWVIPESEKEFETDDKKRKTIKVLLIAIHKDTIAKYKSIAEKAGLVSYTFESEVFSIIRSSLGNDIAPVLIMDMGASTTKMTIVDHGIMRLSYSVNRGSQELSLALSKSLNIDFTRAESMKREIGVSTSPEYKEMVGVINPILEYIFSEANSVIMNYQNKYNRPVSRVILTGGGSLMKGVVDFAVKKLGMEVTLADPFVKVEHPAFLHNVLKEAGPSFAVSLGLALRKLQTN